MSEYTEGRNAKPKRAPLWMSEPGAPPKPDFASYSKQLTDLNDQRVKLLSQIKQLQQSVKPDDESADLRRTRDAIKDQLNEIDCIRKAERTSRIQKNEEMAVVRKERRGYADAIKEIEIELGGFTTAKDFDAAIYYLKRKMESAGGGLDTEKKMSRQLRLLEEGKGMLQQLRPLNEALLKTEEREVQLEHEHRDIHERIGVLNENYEEQLAKKKAIDSLLAKSSSGRTEVYKQCDALRVTLNEVIEKLSVTKSQRQEEADAWNDWCSQAKESYETKRQAEEETRRQEEKDRRAATRLEDKVKRAKKRQNPYSAEIDACCTLLQYLHQKMQVQEAKEQERVRQLAAEKYNPHDSVPEGCVVINEGLSREKNASPKRNTKMFLRHDPEVVSLFRLIEVEPPSSSDKLTDWITKVESKQQEYSSHIRTGDLQLSDDEDNAEEEVEPTESSDTNDQ